MEFRSFWSIVDDAPTDLNFAIFLASALGIFPSQSTFSDTGLWPQAHQPVEDEDKHSLLTRQWNQWWLAMIREKSGKPPGDPRRHEQWSALFSPTEQFHTLDDPLRAACVDFIHCFDQWWTLPAGGQFAVKYWTSRIPFDGIVQQVAQELGRPVRPFHLTVHFVYAGLNDILDLSETYAILGINTPSLTIHNTAWWLNKVRTIA